MRYCSPPDIKCAEQFVANAVLYELLDEYVARWENTDAFSIRVGKERFASLDDFIKSVIVSSDSEGKCYLTSRCLRVSRGREDEPIGVTIDLITQRNQEKVKIAKKRVGRINARLPACLLPHLQ